MPRPYHAITSIVATVYCEQKTVFDRGHGDAWPLAVRVKAVAACAGRFSGAIYNQRDFHAH